MWTRVWTRVCPAIRKPYGVEREAEKQKLPPERIKDLRAEKSRPLLDKFKALRDARIATTPPKSLLGKAISYALTQWDRLLVYLEGGRLRPDTTWPKTLSGPLPWAERTGCSRAIREGRTPRPPCTPSSRRPRPTTWSHIAICATSSSTCRRPPPMPNARPSCRN